MMFTNVGTGIQYISISRGGHDNPCQLCLYDLHFYDDFYFDKHVIGECLKSILR